MENTRSIQFLLLAHLVDRVAGRALERHLKRFRDSGVFFEWVHHDSSLFHCVMSDWLICLVSSRGLILLDGTDVTGTVSASMFLLCNPTIRCSRFGVLFQILNTSCFGLFKCRMNAFCAPSPNRIVYFNCELCHIASKSLTASSGSW